MKIDATCSLPAVESVQYRILHTIMYNVRVLQVHLMYVPWVVCQTISVYSLLKRANKLETAVQGLLACLAPLS